MEQDNYEVETNIIMLTDENGNQVPFEILDLVEYKKKEYVVLLPTDDDDSGEVIILQLVSDNDETESYLTVKSKRVLNAVYKIFKEKFKDILTFED